MAHPMTTVRRFVEDFLGRGDLAVADDTAHERIQGTTGLKPTGPSDRREEYKATIAAFVGAFAAKAPLRYPAAARDAGARPTVRPGRDQRSSTG